MVSAAWITFLIYGDRGLEAQFIPYSEIVHIGIVVVRRGFVHILETIEDGEGVALRDVEVGAYGVAYLLYCHGVVKLHACEWCHEGTFLIVFHLQA